MKGTNVERRLTSEVFGVSFPLNKSAQAKHGRNSSPPFGLKSKASIPKKVRQLLDLTKLNYSIEGEVPNQIIVLNSTLLREEE